MANLLAIIFLFRWLVVTTLLELLIIGEDIHCMVSMVWVHLIDLKLQIIQNTRKQNDKTIRAQYIKCVRAQLFGAEKVVFNKSVLWEYAANRGYNKQ